MALIKIPKEMGSTPGIVDNSNATAITIGSDESTTFSGPIQLTAGALAAAGNAGLSHRSTDNKVYLQAGTGGFNILDDQQNTHFSIDSAGVSSFNNNVGIGTSAPDLPFHVSGTNALPATSGSTPVGMMSLRAKTANASHGLHMGVSNASPWGSWLQAQDANNLATEYPLLLNPNGGNVGIGTSSPVSKLDIASGDLTISNATNAPFINFVDNTTRSNSLARIAMDQVSGTAGQLLFSTTSGGTLAERMRIASDGNVEMRGSANVRISLGTAGTSGANNNSNWIYGNGTNLRFNNAGGFYSWETLGTERMRISAAGIVTTPYQPSFQTAGTNYTQSTSTVSKIIPASEMFDIGNNYSSGTFTAPVAGIYEFAFWGLMYPMTTSHNANIIYRVNDVNRSQIIQGGGNATSHQQMSGSILLNLSEDDYVDLWISTSGGAAYSGQWHMSGKLIG